MTKQELVELIKNRMEDEVEPARIMAWAEANQGKVLRSNNVPKGFKVKRQYNMTHLEPEDRQFLRVGYLLAHRETGVTVPTPERLRKLSFSYYQGAEERNAYRRLLLADDTALLAQAAAVTRASRAVQEYRAAFASLGEICGFQNPEEYRLKRIAGKIEEKRFLL